MRKDPKPDDAWWDPKDNEWVHGARDAQGRLVGEVRYWNADGVLISTADHVDDKPHGVARRYFPDGTIAQDCRYEAGVIHGARSFLRGTGDVPQALTGASASVATYECVYDHGDLVGTLWRDAEGNEVDQHGRPVRARPPGVEPTAFFLSGQGWFFSRRRGELGTETILRREYFETGELRSEASYVDGSERAYHQNGKLKHEGQRNRTGRSHYQTGTWRYYDGDGNLHRVSEFVEGAEVRREVHRAGRVRAGAIDRNMEVGVWTVGDRTIDLGTYVVDDTLLAHAVTAEELDDALVVPGHGIVAVLARARRARDLASFGLDVTPAFRATDETGKLLLQSRSAYDDVHLVGLIDALRWGPPDAPLLAQIAERLFRGDRAHAALDVIDAALALAHEPAYLAARTAYLRGTGHAVEVPSKLDDRAHQLLDEIRAHPDDNAPRLVFADHIANAFPEHTAVVVAQCAGNEDEAIVKAFLATLPEWLTRYNTPTRGFLDDIRYLEGEDFVDADPDLLRRVSPMFRVVELQYATPHFAKLVTLPWLTWFSELSFSDTYISQIPARQLARCKYLDQLEHLGLWGLSLNDDALTALVSGTAYPRLQSLDISYSRDDQSYTLEGVRAIGDAAFAPTLRLLTMPRRWLGDAVVEVIAKLPALVDLDLSNGSLTDDGARALLALPNQWTGLDLADNDFSESMKLALTARFGDGVRFSR